MTRLYKEVINVNHGLEENIMMLENTLESRDQKVYELEEEMKDLEESIPFSSITICNKGKEDAKQEKSLKEHNNSKHADENLPSTSKCGDFEYHIGDKV